MNTVLLFLFTLSSGGHCLAWLPNADDYSHSFDNYSMVRSIDVFEPSAIDDRLADILFPAVYSIPVNGIMQTVQCER